MGQKDINRRKAKHPSFGFLLDEPLLLKKRPCLRQDSKGVLTAGF